MSANNNRKKLLKMLALLIKLAIIAVSFWFIYKQIFVKEQNVGIRKGLRDFINMPVDYRFLAFALLLMPLNWGIEALKWKLLIQRLEKISYFKSMKAIFSGVTVSVFTPNRIGEYGGRVFHLENANIIKATILTVVGSYAQLLVTIVTGLFALAFFLPAYGTTPGYFGVAQYIILYTLGSIIIVVFNYLFLNTSVFSSLVSRMKFLGNYRSYGKVFSFHQSKELLKVLLLSYGRYAVFSLQFFLLLRVFDVNVNFFPALMMISMSYLVMTIIPTIAITDFAVRGSVSLYFIGLLSDNEPGILSASFVLWLINLALPAFIGTLFVFNLNFFRQDKE
ncbi:MAG: hypothetical protein POELPBGB_00042 [Bacteroidia bacterium]|nr:hypothetical protein [Bacteroidia bacterium]